MREYEITYLANPELDEAAKDQLDSTVDSAIAGVKGEINATSPQTGAPGSRRRLHYPVKRARVAWLRTIQARIDPEHVRDLRAALGKEAGIIRLSILQTSQREEVSAAIFDRAAEREKRAADAKKVTVTGQEDANPVTMEEVEEKIAKALDEEVK
jgi:ribosomal protein S6